LESNWRWSVLEYAMQDSDWLLCAGVPDFFPADYVLVQRRGSPWVWLYQRTVFLRPPTFRGRFLITPANPHFPYGFDVDPD
jgi:hypothetical protein